MRTSLDPTASCASECVSEWWFGEQLTIPCAQCRQDIKWTDTQKWMTPFRIKHSEGSNRLIWPLFHLALLMHDNCRGWCPFVTVKHYHLRCSEQFVNCENKLLLPFSYPFPPLIFQEKPYKACPINVPQIRECARQVSVLFHKKTSSKLFLIGKKMWFWVISIRRKIYFQDECGPLINYATNMFPLEVPWPLFAWNDAALSFFNGWKNPLKKKLCISEGWAGVNY